ncbi:MAG: hypothetical protein MPJ50_06290 [Pirellulales bacterium]|nr:hypothetical protein [Pirellulales bacterium]
MHIRFLVELAAQLSSHGPALIERKEPVPRDCLLRYWTASQSRAGDWSRTLKQFTDPDSELLPDENPTPRWEQVRRAMEEIFLSEVLTRVFAAIGAAVDQARQETEATPVVRSVLISHTEARVRVLRSLLQGRGVPANDAIELNRLRKRTERWTDVLVGSLACYADVTEFAAEPERARDFAEDFGQNKSREQAQTEWALVLASLRTSLSVLWREYNSSEDWNGRIAESVIGCFDPELFDESGVFRSLWTTRLLAIADDTQAMLDDAWRTSPQHAIFADGSYLPNRLRGL